MYELDLNFFNLIIIASVFIGLIFGLLLIFTKRINQNANRYLGGVALIIVFWNIWVLSLDLDVFRYYPRFYLIPVNFSLGLGPLMYLYIKKMTTPDWLFSKKDWLHFLPLIFEIIVHVILCKEALEKGVLATDTSAFYALFPAVQMFAIISVVVYCFLALSLIRKYHVWLKANYSDDDKYNLRWLYRLTILFAFFWFMLVPYTLIDYAFYNFQLGIQDYYPIYILLSLMTLWISIEAFLKPEMVFLDNIKNENSDKVVVKPKVSQDVIDKANWLKEEMERNLFYLDSELSLKSLAQNLDIHPNILSKVINEGLGKSFSDFVNEYRVNAIIDRLKDPKYEHITLLGISYECGFNSKTTFNRVFKNITGMTPINYKKSISK